MEENTIIGTETPEKERAEIAVSDPLTERGAEMTVERDCVNPDSASITTEGDTGENGYETEILGDEQPPEELKEPRENINHYADHTFQNNVTIAGTLRTKRWVHPHGCMFQTLEKLKEEYPNPVKGMWAFVGTGFPGKVWICDEPGVWREADPTTLSREDVERLLKDYATEDWVKRELRKYLSEGGELTEHMVEADHAKSAYTLDEDSPVRDEFLSKKEDDTAAGRIKFKRGAHFGDFRAGLYGGTGGAVDARGNGELESLIVRTGLTVMELIINQQLVEQGDTIYTEGDTIESCEPEGMNPDGTMRWWVRIRERYEGYVTGIREGMVVRGVVNNLFDAANPDAPGSYYTSWMRVNGAELGTGGNRLNVTLYADDETPAGRNYPPCGLMTLARWGHQTMESLQRLFHLSSHEGTLVRYEGITKPIIDLGNVASLIGRCPAGMFTDIPGISEGDEIAYFKTVIGNFIQYNHQGKPVPTIVYTGEYDPGRIYHAGWWDYNEETGLRRFITETCTYCGCVWLCSRDGVAGLAPGHGVTAWALYQGNTEFTVDFEERQVVYDESHLDLFGATLTLTARLYNQDVLDLIAPENVVWTRESYDANGALRAASDAAWVPVTDRGNKRLLLTAADLSYDGTEITKMTFTARVAIDDVAASVSTEFIL